MLLWFVACQNSIHVTCLSIYTLDVSETVTEKVPYVSEKVTHNILNFFLFQISDAFKKFGISDSDTAVLIVLVVEGDKTVNLADIASQVEGQQVSLDELPQLTDTAKVKKVCSQKRRLTWRKGIV